MKALIQRSKSAKVSVDDTTIGSIGHGYVVFLGVTHEDTKHDARWLADKIANLRLFEDSEGKMNLSLFDTSGSVLSISQFTLYGEAKKGRRPSFVQAAKPEQAERLYDYFNEQLREIGIAVESGEFGAGMQVDLNNDGPVTLMLESP
ncbi:D-tyrosyl-tRNA(Tyr) deacylase [Salicibibacter halophilus]|uniref:D-aminoacyl-tRNA deacylase n=1 Tax=Salicibibacter halophilus TaxID=2502791 RepID=A0A514LND7_9BACI|nr:D-aminoacyl-tRNA deacylase [Salicibibacter halophilus]QDI92831.1 D-tyrosyl-tRNA(Tyr) deacylase [Salicibibacter halophilus]